MNLIQDLLAHNLDKHRFNTSAKHDIEMNCYNLHTANVLKEIIYRKIYLNEPKEQSMLKIQDEFKMEAFYAS